MGNATSFWTSTTNSPERVPDNHSIKETNVRRTVTQLDRIKNMKSDDLNKMNHGADGTNDKKLYVGKTLHTIL